MPILAGPDVSIEDSIDIYTEYQDANNESGGSGPASGSYSAEDVVKGKVETTAPHKFGPHVAIYDPQITTLLRGEF